MKITDSDIIASLLEDTSPKAGEDLPHIFIHDAETVERFRQWSSILSGLEVEREALREIQELAMGRVMQRIAEEGSPYCESTVSPVDWRGRFRPTRKRVGGFFAVAACMLIVAGYMALTPTRLGSSAVPAHVASTEPAIYLDFGFKGEGIGTDSQPFTTLGEAVASVQHGAVLRIAGGGSREKLRIAKPMRIEAFGGSARIGNL